MISYKRDVLERQSVSEIKRGRGSPICERVCKKIVEYFKNNVPQHQIATALQISSSTVHNIIIRFRETGEISVRKGHGRRLLFDAHQTRTLHHCICTARHCITHRHDSVIDITKWAQEYFQKPLSVNTICRAICRCQLKLYHAKRKPYVNMVQKQHRVVWAKAPLKWTVSNLKMFYGQTRLNLTFLLEITDTVSSGLKRRETFQHVIRIHFKSQHLWWYGQLACFGGRQYKCWKVYIKGFSATYASLQTMSISAKPLCFSAGQCNTTYCSYCNSMALY